MDTPTVQDFTDALYHYAATMRKVVDGDTIEVELSLGCRVYMVRRIRLLGYDAPELFSGDDRTAGAAARDHLAILLPAGCRLYIQTELDRTSFDRLLGFVYAAGDGPALLDVAAAMIAAGHGTPA